MAEISNTTSNSNFKRKEYATDEAGMMRDAKEYASRDFKGTCDIIRKVGIKEEQVSEEMIAKALILTKYNQIKESRTNRVTYFD